MVWKFFSFKIICSKGKNGLRGGKYVHLMLQKQMETVDSYPTGANRNESWRGEGKCQHGESLESREEKQAAMRLQ